MPKAFGSFADFMAWLDGRGLFHVELGLERISAALEAAKASPFFSVQVLGTNGKGSTATFLEALARAHGRKTGLYTSPHLVCPRERILIDGRELPEGEWLSCANEIMANIPNAADLTYFEFLTLMAVMLFAQNGVDLAVIEAGLGGKNDATSAIAHALHVFAPIDLDHAAIIGPTLADIARDKAAAIRPGFAVCSAPQLPEARKIIESAAQKAGAPVFWADSSCAEFSPGLRGAHQRANAALALLAFQKAAQILGFKENKDACAQALEKAFIPGRLQMATARLLLDGAHNPHALRQILPEAKKILGPKITIVFAALADKDWRQMGAILTENFPEARFIVPQIDNPRALAAEELAGAINAILPESAQAAKDTQMALQMAHAGQDKILAVGSLYLLSEIFGLYPQYLHEGEDNGK